MDVQHAETDGEGAFFVEQDGQPAALMVYTRQGPQRITIEHTEVADSLRGTGAGKHLLHALVAWAREGAIRVTPRCPFARAQFDKDPALRDVLASA
jgi:hypothetical protein